MIGKMAHIFNCTILTSVKAIFKYVSTCAYYISKPSFSMKNSDTPTSEGGFIFAIQYKVLINNGSVIPDLILRTEGRVGLPA